MSEKLLGYAIGTAGFATGLLGIAGFSVTKAALNSEDQEAQGIVALFVREKEVPGAPTLEGFFDLNIDIWDGIFYSYVLALILLAAATVQMLNENETQAA